MGRSLALVFRVDDADEVGRVACAELLHDAGAVDLDRARADAKLASGFLVGGAERDALQNLAFTRRELLLAEKAASTLFLAPALRALASRASRTRVTTVSASKGFSMKSCAPCLIASTAIGMSPWPEIMNTGAGEARFELAENIEARAPRHMHVQNDAGRRPCPQPGKERRAVGEGAHIEALQSRKPTARRRAPPGSSSTIVIASDFGGIGSSCGADIMRSFLTDLTDALTSDSASRLGVFMRDDPRA